MYHQAVLLNEAVEGLAVKPEGTYVDVTFGGGGHSRAILDKLGAEGRLFAFDRDSDASENALDDDRFTLIEGDFRFLNNYLKMYGAVPFDGLIADLGVSSHQFDTAERGFSTRFEGELDMRMDRGAAKSALTVINEYEEEELARIFRNYGELKNARGLARAIIKKRGEVKLNTTEELKQALAAFAPRGKEAKFYAKVFQALRIEVNDELEGLRELLKQATESLKPEGRLVVIAYHSLEDRPVKYFMKSGNFEGKQEKDLYGNIERPLRPLNNKPIMPEEAEMEQNPRARSAKLRIAIKNG